MPDSSPDRWSLIERFLEEAAALPSPERAAFLTEATDDAALRAEVAALLAADGEAAVFFDGLAGALAPEADGTAAPGTRIEAWEVVGILGRGGMGTVYHVRRADGAYEQDAALKLLDTMRPGHVARFQQERQILARLDHPGIARLLDGGTTPEGRPFLVMERIDGMPITDYATEHGLDVAARLRLFARVCEAVQAAHQNLVVHRDIKPSNVFVTPSGQVKLLDFGIARLLDADESAPLLTRTEQRVLTPEYAAPEQVRGDAVTTATDVYALGVLLYELLAGTRPFRLATRLQHEAARIILEDEPERPSTAVTRAARASASRPALQRRLRGDLDRICLKALRKAPARRYATAEAFARDVERHLGGLPVEARPDTLGYRVHRFARRHRNALALASMGGLVLIMLGLAHTAQLREERDRAEALAEYAVGLFAAGDPFELDAFPPDVTYTEVLRRAASEAEVDLRGSDRLLVMETVAHSLHVLGDTMGTQIRERARDLAESDFGAGSVEEAGASATLAWSIMDSDPDRADSLYSQAIAVLERSDASRVKLGTTLSDYGFFLKYASEPERAEIMLVRAVSVFRSLGEAQHDNLATVLEHYAVTLATLGRAAEAEAARTEGLALTRAIFGERSVRYGTALANAASVASAAGDSDESARLNRAALAALGDDLAPNHSLRRVLLNNLTVNTTDPAERLALTRDLLRSWEADDVPDVDFRGVIQNLASAYLQAGQPDSARALASRARRAYLASSKRDGARPSFPLLTAAEASLMLGADAAAREAAAQGASELRDLLGGDHWVTRYAEGLEGCAQGRLGDARRGMTKVTRALAAVPEGTQHYQRLADLAETCTPG